MKLNNNFNDSFDELVFENRNKDYGAYAIRMAYNTNVSKALIYTTSLLATLVFAAWYFTGGPEKIIVDNVLVPADLGGTLINLKPPVIPKTSNSSGHKTGPNAPPVVSDKPDPKPAPTPDPDPASGGTGTKGNADSTAGSTGLPPVDFPPVAATPSVVKVPDIMPGMPDLYKHIHDLLHYPQIAVEDHIEGTVYLSFIVETDGSISNIETLKKVPDGCSEEAIRVLKALPHWNPGMKDNKPVRVPCTLPIKFVLK